MSFKNNETGTILSGAFKAEAKYNITSTEVRSVDRKNRRCKSEGEKCDTDSVHVT